MIANVVAPGDVKDLWPVVGPMLESAIDQAKGETTLEHVLQSLIEDRSRLITIRDDGKLVAAGTIHMNMYPTKKVCQVSLLGGEGMAEWCDGAIRTVEALALNAGADAVYIQGRRGWVKRLKHLGFEEYSTLVVKELKENKS